MSESATCVPVRAGDQPAKPGDDGQSESSAGDGNTDGQSSVASGNSVRALCCRTQCVRWRAERERVVHACAWCRSCAPGLSLVPDRVAGV